jgi:hypothetical protein
MFLVLADNQRGFDEMLAGEKSIPEYSKLRIGPLLPIIIKRLIR